MMKKIFTLAFLAVMANMAAAQTFTSGNIVVARLGNGTNPTTSGANPVTLLELNPSTGALTNTVTIPFSTAGQRLVINSNSAAGANEGGISLSADGRYIVVGGSDVAQFNSNTGSSNKSFARVNMAGLVEMFTINSNLATGYIRSTATLDGSAIYSTGGYGLAYAVWGNTTNTTFRFSTTGSNYVQVIGNKLYSASGTNPATILYFGNAPTSTTTNNGTALAGTSASTVQSNYGFAMLDMDNTVSNANDGNDVLYMVDQTVASPGIVKMAYNSTTANWDYVGKYATANPVYGLTGRVVNDKVELYTVNNSGDNNSVISIVDANTRTTFAGASITTNTLASAGTNYVFRSVAFSPTVNVLPIKLTSFSGSSTLNGAILKWTTTNENNVKNISLMRKVANSDFKVVDIVEPKNGSINNYQINDLGLSTGTYYYQIKTTDLDGTVSLSQVISVTVKGGNTLSVYPNPAKDLITVQFPFVGEKATLKIYNILGKVMTSTNLDFNTTQYSIDVSKYESGKYIIQINDGLKTETISFIK